MTNVHDWNTDVIVGVAPDPDPFPITDLTDPSYVDADPEAEGLGEDIETEVWATRDMEGRE